MFAVCNLYPDEKCMKSKHIWADKVIKKIPKDLDIFSLLTLKYCPIFHTVFATAVAVKLIIALIKN